MSDFDKMSGSDYERLYARFVNSPTAPMLRLAQGLDKKTVLDVCSGNLRLTWDAYDAGAKKVVSLDHSSHMMCGKTFREGDKKGMSVGLPFSWEFCEDDITLGFPMMPRLFDVAFCQQAINYWWSVRAVNELAHCLKDDGRFIFNTFLCAPKAWPEMSIREYELNGHLYRESSWLQDNDEIFHIQQCDKEHHISIFKWIPFDEIEKVMSDVFKKVTSSISGNTVIFAGYEPKRK